MPNTRDLKLGSRIRCLVYGKSRVGKTFGAATFPRPNFILFDPNGIDTVKGPDFVSKWGNRDIEYGMFYERNRNPRGVVTSHNAFDDACLYFDSWMKPTKRDQFDTWVIDSGTTLSEAALNKAIVLLGGKGMGTASQTHAQAMLSGLVFPKIQDYGSERSMVEQFVQMVLDSDKHVILLCHEKEVTNSTGATTDIVPLLTGKSVEAVCLKFSDVWNLRARTVGTERKRELITQADGIRLVGSRYGVPSGIEWNYDAVVASFKLKEN